jgi:ATP-dependent RNA helicase SUPV3L1/SUV3
METGEAAGDMPKPQEQTVPAPAGDAAVKLEEDPASAEVSAGRTEASVPQDEPPSDAPAEKAAEAEVARADDATPVREAEPEGASQSIGETFSGEEIGEPAPQEPFEAAADTVPVEEQAPEIRMIMLWRPGRHDARPRHFRRERHDGQADGDASKARGRPGGKERFDRRFSGGKGKPNDRRDGRPDRGDHAKNGGKGKQVFGGRAREEKPKPFDPDSPFAKLAALREQLKK